MRTGPVREVWLPPEKHRSSQTVLPVIVAPAASKRVTTVASRVGTKPSTVSEPFIIGTPATMMLSLMATVRPANGPSMDSWISVVTYHAPSGLSESGGRLHWRSVRGVGAVRGVQLLDGFPRAQQAGGKRGERRHVGGTQAEAVSLADSGQVGLNGRSEAPW